MAKLEILMNGQIRIESWDDDEYEIIHKAIKSGFSHEINFADCHSIYVGVDKSRLPGYSDYIDVEDVMEHRITELRKKGDEESLKIAKELTDIFKIVDEYPKTGDKDD